MTSKTINRKIGSGKIILYRRASTKAQATSSYKDQLNTIKAIYPDFSIVRSTIGNIAEAKSGRDDAEKRFASGLGTVLRQLKRQPDTILLVSELTRLARRTDVFELIKAQGFGSRVYDATTGLNLNGCMKLGLHSVIQNQTRKQRASRIRGMVRLMKDGGDIGNQDIASQSATGILTKKRIAKDRAANILASLSQMVIHYRGCQPSYEEICDELDRRGIRTGQGNFFTPERLAQFKKNNTRKWNYALDSYHRSRRNIRESMIAAQTKHVKRRTHKRYLRLFLSVLAHKPTWLTRANPRSRCRRTSLLHRPRKTHSMTGCHDGCRGPPDVPSTVCAAQMQ